MVEIAKALSFEATKVLIMDEPTAALNDAEVDQLHELIRRFITPETGVVYISHRMAELKRIADRITVIRDGHYIDTMPMAETSLDEVIAKMVGRAINTGAKPHNVRDDRPIVLSVSGLSTKALLKDITLRPAPRRGARLRRPDGCRAHRGRTGPRRRRPDHVRHDHPQRQPGHHLLARPRPQRWASVTCPRTASGWD